MSSWREILQHAATNVEEHFDALKYELVERLGLVDPVVIVPYRGYGTEQELWLKGRLLEEPGPSPSDDNDTIWDNLVAMWQRFESDEVPGVRIRAQFGEVVQETLTDEEGYFEVRLPLTEPLPRTTTLHEVALELLDEVVPGQGPVRTTGRVLVPPPDADFLIVSDIDDTVVRTHAADILKLARTVFLGNARTRLPFEGVAAFYNALQAGPRGTSTNPVFYLSSSPWNLYDLFVEFMALRGIPDGPILLQDYGLDREKLVMEDHQVHKLRELDRIAGTYPHLPLVLIGDSGQRDPEIYLAAAEQFPGRIHCIYIRDVSDERRDEEVLHLVRRASELGVEMMAVTDTAEAAAHSLERGWITSEAFEKVRAECRQERKAEE